MAKSRASTGGTGRAKSKGASASRRVATASGSGSGVTRACPTSFRYFSIAAARRSQILRRVSASCISIVIRPFLLQRPRQILQRSTTSSPRTTAYSSNCAAVRQE